MKNDAFTMEAGLSAPSRVKIGDSADGRRGAKALFVVDQLRADILARRLPPAARLVEGRLTARYNVSRGPVREALARLHAEGLVELVANRGAFVRQLTEQDVVDLFEMRAELETLAAKRAARAAATARKGARDIIRKAANPPSEPGSAAELLAENDRFHGAILALAGNRSLDAVCRPMHLSFVAQIGPIFNVAQIRLLACDHAAISEAILDGDEDAASGAMRSHVQASGMIALERLKQRTAAWH